MHRMRFKLEFLPDSLPASSTSMPPYVLSPIDIGEARRVGEVQQAAFGEDPLTLAALLEIPKDNYISWVAHLFISPDAPPAHRPEYVCARDTETKVIAGWALWMVPLTEGEEWARPETKVPLPDAINRPVWEEFFAGVTEHEQRIMGDRKRWRTYTLILHVRR